MTTFRRVLSILCYAERDGRVLMMHRRKEPNLGLWTAPGGKLEWDEAPVETCVREMREETGLEVVRPELRGIITEVSPVEHYQWTMFMYVAREFSGEVGECVEGELAWVPIEELLTLPIPEADRIFTPRILDWGGRFFNGKFFYDENLRLMRWEDL